MASGQWPSTPECSAEVARTIASLVPNLGGPGTAAASSLCVHAWAELAEKWGKTGPMHGKETDAHIPLGERLQNPQKLELHNNIYNSAEGHAYALLFRLLLRAMKDMDLWSRMSSVPKAAKDVDVFHGRQSANFHRMCRRSWMEMCHAQRSDTLGRFLFTKFSTDPKREAMMPPPGKKPRQAEICWSHVYLSAQERDELVAKVMHEYAICAAELYRAGFPLNSLV